MKNIKITLVFAALLSFAFEANAQRTDSANTPIVFRVGIIGGISLPLGNFKKTDYQDAASGFAGNGYHFGATGTCLFTDRLGLTASLSYRQFSFSGIQQISDGFHEAFDVDSASATTKGTNHSVSFLIGPHYSLPVSKHISIDFDYGVGIVYSTLAGWDVVLTDAGITHPPLSQNISRAASFGYQGGLGIRYAPCHRWSVAIKGAYFYSKPDFTIVNVDRLANAGRMIEQYNQQVSGIDASLNLEFNLRQ